LIGSETERKTTMTTRKPKKAKRRKAPKLALSEKGFHDLVTNYDRMRQFIDRVEPQIQALVRTVNDLHDRLVSSTRSSPVLSKLQRDLEDLRPDTIMGD